jgi:diacylglycerol kinase (ATP)
VLLGNVGAVGGGLHVFDDASPDDGWLEVGVATADTVTQWAKTLGHLAFGNSLSSPFVHITRGKKIRVKFGEPMMYELDGSSRETVSRLRAKVIENAVTIYVPREV